MEGSRLYAEMMGSDGVDQGSKAVARKLMIEAGVPVVPGYEGDDQSDERIVAEAERIGLLIVAHRMQFGWNLSDSIILVKAIL